MTATIVYTKLGLEEQFDAEVEVDAKANGLKKPAYIRMILANRHNIKHPGNDKM